MPDFVWPLNSAQSAVHAATLAQHNKNCTCSPNQSSINQNAFI